MPSPTGTRNETVTFKAFIISVTDRLATTRVYIRTQPEMQNVPVLSPKSANASGANRCAAIAIGSSGGQTNLNDLTVA